MSSITSNTHSPAKGTRSNTAKDIIGKAISKFVNKRRALGPGGDSDDEIENFNNDVPILTARNYYTWSMKMELKLLSKGLSEYIITDKSKKNTSAGYFRNK